MNLQKNSIFLLFFFSIFIISSCSTNHNQSLNEIKTELKTIMNAQEKAWNSGNMEQFMQAYWKSDSLKFLSNNRLTYGWNQQLSNYQKAYPDASIMGKLKFEITSVELIDQKSVLLIGTYHLKRKAMDDAFGYYSLIWRKMADEWVIVFDHSS